jgi:hypothetical protein
MLQNEQVLQDELGLMFHESKIKAGLLRLNPNFVFDLPGRRLNLHHPRIEQWQNIRLSGRLQNDGHVGSMDRGDIPEADVWAYDAKSNRPLRVLRIGWRTTLEAISKHHISGLEWPEFCREFQIVRTDRKVVFVEPDNDSRIVPVYRARELNGWV